MDRNFKLEREDWSLLRTIPGLAQKAGVAQDRIPEVLVKELVDNALDTGAACRFGALDASGFFVEDDADGISDNPEEVAALFSMGRPLQSSKLFRLPTRGAQGHGLRLVAGAVFASAGDLVVETRGRRLRLEPRADGTTTVTILGSTSRLGTRVEVMLGSSLAPNGSIFRLATIAQRMKGDAGYRGRPSAYWFDTDSFYELLQAGGDRSVRELIAQFDGCSGSKAGSIAARFRNRVVSSLTHAEAEELLALAREHSRPVRPARLGRVGPADDLPYGYATVECQYRLEASRGELPAVIPCVIEAWAASAPGAEFLVGVNRTPVVGESWSGRQKHQQRFWGFGVDFSLSVGHAAMRVLLNIQTPFIPRTDDGKNPNVRVVRAVVQKCVELAVRRAKRKSGGVRRGAHRVTQASVIEDALPAAIEKASGGGVHRFSVRQLYYLVRPRVNLSLGEVPTHAYFAKTLGDIEARQGHDIPGLYRDPRGTLLHPHTGQRIPLGTLSVEEYERPKFLFNKILYAEKEGFFEVLEHAKWPARHDCALMTAKGFPTRAARDLLDLLGDSEEELLVFCLHDADAFGTTIMQSLQEGTHARPRRRVRVIDLGLNPEEAIEMGLEVEDLTAEERKGVRPVARYIEEPWGEWLQEHRVELNAMTTPQLIEFLDAKMEEFASGRLVPPAPALLDHAAQHLRSALRVRLTDEILRDGRLEDRLVEAAAEHEPKMREDLGDLEALIRDRLDENPESRWTVELEHAVDDTLDSPMGGPSKAGTR